MLELMLQHKIYYGWSMGSNFMQRLYDWICHVIAKEQEKIKMKNEKKKTIVAKLSQHFNTLVGSRAPTQLQGCSKNKFIHIKEVPVDALSTLIQKNSFQTHKQTAILLKGHHWSIPVHLFKHKPRVSSLVLTHTSLIWRSSSYKSSRTYLERDMQCRSTCLHTFQIPDEFHHRPTWDTKSIWKF